jgi:hypothetical protein
MLRVLILSARFCDIKQDGQPNIVGVSVYYTVPGSNDNSNPELLGDQPNKAFLPPSEWDKIKTHGVMAVYDAAFQVQTKNGASVIKLTKITPVKS